VTLAASRRTVRVCLGQMQVRFHSIHTEQQ
jgi:hypothetical protein